MLNRMKEIFQTNKIVKIIASAVIVLVILVLGLLLFMSLRGTWVKGGADTKGPFRYCVRSGGKIDVKIDTSNLPEGNLYVVTEDSETIQTTDKGIRGQKQCYRIYAKNAVYEEWTVKLYADEAAKKKDEALYLLTISISRDDENKLEVLSANANDIDPVTHVEDSSCDYQYQVQNTDIDTATLLVQIMSPLEDTWYADYDEKLLQTTSFFYGQDAIYNSFMSLTEDDFDTEVTLYTMTDDDSDESNLKTQKDIEIRLRVKGSNGQITEVTHE